MAKLIPQEFMSAGIASCSAGVSRTYCLIVLFTTVPRISMLGISFASQLENFPSFVLRCATLSLVANFFVRGIAK